MANYHVVHSVKGGCGKSAFSLFLSLIFSKESKMLGSYNDIFKSPDVLLIDVDLRGSATKSLYYECQNEAIGKKEKFNLIDNIEENEWNKLNESTIFVNKNLCLHINDYFKSTLRLCDITQQMLFVWNSGVAGSSANNPYYQSLFDMVFSDPSKNGKHLFKYDADAEADNMPMNIGMYESKMRKLLKEIKNSDNKYKNIVFDLPPSSDEYSNSLMKLLQKNNRKNNKGKKKDERDKLYIHLIATGDIAHRFALEEYIMELLEGNNHYDYWDKIIVTVNRTCSDDVFEKSLYEDHIRERCAKMNILDLFNDKVVFINMEFQPDYFSFTHSVNNNDIGKLVLDDELLSFYEKISG